ncbi:hypothetical protein [Leisingera thetidis]|uniref:hypothetical protein n=1 Tax=Leisingera thetidis TaxID=2930199 RepID=UPI0021F72178|nr:hypothetical protein [Leisingera thetidis]
MTVLLAHHRRSDADRLEAHIRTLGEVTEGIAAGGMDFALTSPPSPAVFQNLTDALLTADLGIGRCL